MPRQRRGATAPTRHAPARPTVAPTKPPQQSARNISTSTHAAVATQQPGPPAQTGKSPGLFGQMASTAAGVAVGSSIGHAIGGFFGGGSSNATTEHQTPDNTVASQVSDAGYQSTSWGPQNCETDARSFTKCLDENGGNMQICGWYLDQLKACQSAASQY